MFFIQKYITNPIFTLEDAFLAAAANLADVLRDKMPNHLKESSVQKLSQLKKLFSETTTNNNIYIIRA